MIKDFTPRLYQETILATAVKKNTLVVLPTGMGKTSVALMLAAQRLKQYPESKILILAPTRPLVDQHLQTFKKHFEIDASKLALFTGYVKPEKREELWKTAQVIFSTPQGLQNDIICSRIDLREISLLVFDECHRATGDYAYVWVAKQYNKLAKYPRILALTASPGSDLEKISEVTKNLYIEEIEARTDQDPDVKPYIQQVDMIYVKVDLPAEFKVIQKFLSDCYTSKLKEMQKYGYLNSVHGYSKKDMLGIQAGLQAQIARGDKSFELLKSLSLAAEAMKVQHAVELVETQGVLPLFQYMEKLQHQAATTKVKAVQNLVRDINFRSALIKTQKLVEQNIEHPKLAAMQDIIKEHKGQKIIIFTQYRDSATRIIERLKEAGIDAKLFVGQMKKGETGMSQKEQIQILQDFREDKFDILTMTSVGEEGLDIPTVDLVLFYEPVPSAIRTIQRKGRTGRTAKGKVITLITRATRDEAYRWSAHHKEKRMYRTIGALKKQLALTAPKNQGLKKFIAEEDKVKIYVDHREQASNVVKELIELGVSVKLEQLEVGDFLCSGDVGVEFKTAEDFVNSIIDGRLLQQMKELKRNFAKPVIIVEGEQDIYNIRNVHPNAIRGMLATIAVSYGIPLLYTKHFRDTAAVLATIAKREQAGESKDFSLHGQKHAMSLSEQQEYVVSSLPNIGPNVAKALLREFKSVKAVVNASESDLKKVEKVGEKKAKQIREVLDSDYEL